MNTFNQTNPIHNYNQIIENIDETKKKLKKIKKKLGKLFVLIQKYPQFNIVFLNIISNYKKYLGLLITVNNNLKKYFELIPFSNKFYDFYLMIYQNILIKTIEFEAIYKTKDEAKIQAYLDSIEIDDYSYFFYSNNNVQQKIADLLNLVSNKVRTFDCDEFREELMEYFENLQTSIIDQINTLGKQVDNQSLPLPPPPQIPISAPAAPAPTKQGGSNKFDKIFHPEKNVWVNVKSLEGKNVLLQYLNQ